MNTTMKAIVLEAHNTAKMKEIPIPACSKGEILIRTKAATVCTSDILDMKYNLFNLSLPIVMGHEAAGIVAAVGEGVTDIAVGDEVAVHPVMPCYKCPSCLRDLSHLCDEMEHLAFNRPGVFAEYFVTRPDCVRKKPSGVSFPLASLMEPVCVCLEAINRAKVKPGDRVLIAGDGPFGIMMSKLCASRDPKMIIQTGWNEGRLKHAASPSFPDIHDTMHEVHQGCSKNALVTTINEKKTPDTARLIMELTQGEGVDSAILCVSNPSAVDLCIEMLRSRGTLVIFSALSGKTPVDLLRVHLKELTIAGSNNDENFMDDAIRLLSDPVLNLSSIVTHELPFEKWEEAFNMAEHTVDSCLKVSMVL